MSKIGPKVNNLLDEIRLMIEESLKSSDEPDAFDVFMSDNAKHVARETGLSEDEALNLLFSIAEASEELGTLPPVPTLYTSEEQLEEWIKAANTSGFVLNAVEEARKGASE